MALYPLYSPGIKGDIPSAVGSNQKFSILSQNPFAMSVIAPDFTVLKSEKGPPVLLDDGDFLDRMFQDVSPKFFSAFGKG